MIFKQGLRRSMLRSIALMMAICMLGSGLLVSAASAASPADIRGAWSEKTLLEWMAKGWLSGYPDGTVRPKQEVRRAEFFTLANRSLGFVDESDIAFSDVKPGSWIAKQAAIAVKAGYDSGYPDGTMQPDRSVTREEAAIMIAKAFGLQPKPSETSVFTDTASVSNEGRGAIGALVAAGVLAGYPDGTVKPRKVITREEAVVILDGALKKLDRTSDKDRTFSAAGTYGPASGTETVAGNVVVAAAGVTLRNLDIQGDLLLSAGIGEGDASLDNVIVKGTVTVNGGGPNSIHLKDSQLETLVVDKKNGNVRIAAKGSTTVKRVDLRSGSKLESEAAKDRGFRAVHLTKEMPAGSKVSLLGEFPEASVASSNIELELLEGAIRELNVLSGASGNTLTLEDDTQIDELTLEEETAVQGQGAIDHAIIGDRAKDSKFEREPGKLEGDIVPLPGTGGGGGGGNGDTIPPGAPVVTGVQHQQTYITPVTPNWEDVAGTTSTATLTKKGSPKNSYTRNTEISEDGSYVLSVTVRKNSNGLTAHTTIEFTIDSVPPAAPVIEGISDGGRYFSALPSWTDAPGTVSEAMLSKDGQAAASYDRETLIDEEGDYVLTITATKTSNGLTAATTIRFAIDTSLTQPIVTGIAENQIYFEPVTISWEPPPGANITGASLRNVATGEITDNIPSPTTLSDDGTYALSINTEINGNEFTYVYPFVIAGIRGLNDGETYWSVTPDWIEPLDFGSYGKSEAILSKNGDPAIPYTKGTTIDEEGEYELTVTWYTRNNHSATQSVSFTIAPSFPTPDINVLGTIRSIGGVLYHYTATLHWTDPPGTTSTAMLKVGDADPVPFDKRNVIEEDGDYEVTVTWTDLSTGLTATKSQQFKVHIGAARPYLSVEGDKGIYYEPVTISWTPRDKTRINWTSLENMNTNERYDNIPNPMTILEDGEYEFKVEVTRDNETKQYIHQFVLAGIRNVEDRAVYIDSVTPDWFSQSIFSSRNVMWLNKNDEQVLSYNKGDTISEPGEYELNVNWLVYEKNVKQKVSFTIVEPVEVTGVEYGGTYVSAAPTWAEAPPGRAISATLAKDGGEAAPYTSGTAITEDGSYVLTLTTRVIWSGREVQQNIMFTIDSVPPVEATIAISGNSRVLSGVTAYYSADLTWSEPTGTTATAMLRKDGAEPVPYTMGALIDQDGDYELIVTTLKQSNGLTSTATRTFHVNAGPVQPVLTGFADNAILFGPAQIAWTPHEGTQIDWVRLSNLNTNESDEPSNPITLEQFGEYEFSVGVRKGEEIHSYYYRFTVAGVSGIEEGGVYTIATPEWFDPVSLGEVEAVLTRGGVPVVYYANGDRIFEPGEYVLTVTWRNDAGNTATKSIRFSIDSEPLTPVTVTGVVYGGVYPSASPTWDDIAGLTITATLSKDGGTPESYEKGTPISEVGDYVLTVTAMRGDGQTAVTEIAFTIGEDGPVVPTSELIGDPNGLTAQARVTSTINTQVP